MVKKEAEKKSDDLRRATPARLLPAACRPEAGSAPPARRPGVDLGVAIAGQEGISGMLY